MGGVRCGCGVGGHGGTGKPGEGGGAVERVRCLLYSSCTARERACARLAKQGCTQQAGGNGPAAWLTVIAMQQHSKR